MSPWTRLLLASAVAGVGYFAGAANAPPVPVPLDVPAEVYATRGDNGPEEALRTALRDAKASVDVAAYSLTDPELVDALLDAHRRGVAVRIVTDREQSRQAPQARQLKRLREAGIPVRTNTYAGKMHLKLVVVDGEIAFFGSYNLTRSAATRNDEVLVAVRGGDAVRPLAQKFDEMWTDPRYAPLP
ncbi:phospholipase D-like domain-containing protein [Brockia lithotrophica]|uniref:phospholipase D n=1 Tax=Brockia lithotrophica TaxID=933949 RepID=A0A660L6W4_9BACL|nr:phospholipase D-like domain-containing protein [Brockia lithotrophica]RKQ88964.1 phospholipase D-like protein [Brockia lithotrophica]